MKKRLNWVKFQFAARPENIALARVAAASFASQMDWNLADLDEIKVAVSEAVSNAIIHGYDRNPEGVVELEMSLLEGEVLEFIVRDSGKGIPDVKQAMEPAFSTLPDSMGLGFTFMQSFMDELEVESSPGRGTTVTMRKKFPAEAGV